MMSNGTESEKLPFPRKIHIIYASQTGQAESISEYIFDNFIKSDQPLKQVFEKLGTENVQRHCIEQYEEQLACFWEPNDKDQLVPGAYLVVLVASTTGQGDPPDKALRFFRWLRRLKRTGNKSTLRHISYALLGLGDTNYDNFANFSKQVKKHFDELGATPYVTPEFADDAVGLELVTEPFIENLVETIFTHYLDQSLSISEDSNIYEITEVSSSKETLSSTPIQTKTQKETKEKEFDKTEKTETVSIETEKVSKEDEAIGESNPSKKTGAYQLIKTENKWNATEKVSEDYKTIDKENIVEKNVTSLPLESDTELSEVETESEEESEKMNINRPVVSSCRAYVLGSHRRNLSEVCRELVELSAHLSHIADDDLQLPKVSAADSNECFIYNKRQVEKELKEVKVFSMYEFLQSKVPNKSPLFEGELLYNRLLSCFDLENVNCCHTEKIVLECVAKYREKISVDGNNSEKQLEQQAFCPGDSFGFYTANMLSDVYIVVRSITVKHLDGEDEPILLWHYFKGNKKQAYLLLNDKVTAVELLPYLVYGVDLRTIPKKAALCHLAKFTSDKKQSRRLLELSSRQGADEYQKLILAHSVTFIDLFRLFDTCHPPINVLLSYLISSRPRYFSSCSVPQSNPSVQGEHSFKIALGVMNNFTHTFIRPSESLLGFLSGKFFQHYKFFNSKYYTDLECSNVWKKIKIFHSYQRNGRECDFHDATIIPNISVPAFIFPRANKLFQLVELDKPLVLIAAGIGIAPFMSFFDYRMMVKQDKPQIKLGPITLFYGCQHPFRDLAYGKELIEMANNNTLKHLCLCFSRCVKKHVDHFAQVNKLNLCQGELDPNDENGMGLPKHVDQLIRLHGEDLTNQLAHQEALVYVCGNYKKISQTILKAFLDILARHLFGDTENADIQSPEATRFLKDLQQKKRFLQDVW